MGLSKKIPVICAFARSGGTLLNRCLGCIPGNLVLSEVNPHSSVIPVEIQASNWLNLIPANQLHEFIQKSYRHKIEFLVDAAQRQHKHLIIRDWPTLNFIDTKQPNDMTVPSMVLEQALYLSHYGFIPQIAVMVRRSADVYDSIKRIFDYARWLPVEEFGISYLKYAQAVSNYSVFKYENFCENPNTVLKQICSLLTVNYSDEFATKFINFEQCTGDNSLSKESRGLKLKVIAKLKSNEESEYYKAALSDKNCQQADKLLGYDN